MNSQTNRRVKKKRVKRKKNRGNRGIRNPQKIPNVISDVHFCYMKYTSQVIGLTGGSNHASQFYYINSVYHPEGTGTDTSNAIGFTELITLYETWQVYGVRIRMMIANEEAFEVVVTIAPSLSALALTTAPLALQLGEMPYGRTTTLSRNSGMNRASLRLDVNIGRLVGNRNFYHGTQSWYGGQAVKPANLVYVYFAVASLTGDNLTNGVTFNFCIDYKVKWSGRIFSDILGLRGEEDDPDKIDSSSVVRTRQLQ